MHDDLFSYGPRNLREFLKRNYIALLYTLIIHLVILIILVQVRVQGLKHDRELGVMLDFTEEVSEELPAEELPELPAEWLERVFEAREKASNRAVNLNDIERENLSTDQYVQELLNELEAQKDEEFLKDREKWEDIISSYVYDEDPLPERREDETTEEPFTGPTTITFEFLEPPLERTKHMLTIPVYRCEGSAIVVVDLVVGKNGSVNDARVVRTESVNQDPCFTAAALSAALSSTFQRRTDAPDKHAARITYQFIAQ
jgi:hypothetical protein